MPGDTKLKFLLFLFLIPVLIYNTWLAFTIHQLASQRALLKKDYAEVNSIKYGILSADTWIFNISKIVNKRIDDFSFSDEQEAVLRQETSKILNVIITKADSVVQNDDNSLKGKLRKIAINTFVNADDVRKRIPVFTGAIVKEIKKPKNIDKLKGIVKTKVNEYAQESYSEQSDSSQLKKLLAKYSVENITSFNKKTAVEIDNLQNKTYHLSFIIIATLLAFLLLWWVIMKRAGLRKPMFVLCVVLALIVLVTGITSPMIEIDARIKKIEFTLMGEHLQFNEQVIFYQSKSILDVVRILIATKKIDSVIVGILILSFSILFPVSKLISTEIYLLGSDKTKKNILVKFFALHSGKWSMADVMVVAIFMAYIGFKGILDSQLSDLNFKTEDMASIATNQTALQPGFIIFTSFVIYGLILSVILERITKKSKRLAEN